LTELVPMSTPIKAEENEGRLGMLKEGNLNEAMILYFF